MQSTAEDDKVIQRITNNINDVNIVNEGFKYISNEAGGNDRTNDAQLRRKELIKNKAGVVVIKGMKVHSNDKDIQEQGCRALRNLLIHNEHNQEELMKLGAGEVIVEAMNNHKGNINIEYHGCAALSYLAWNSENKISLMNIGVDDVVLNLLMNYKDNPKVQSLCLMTISNLAGSNNQNQATLMKKGVDERILAVMNNHKMDENVQEKGCSAFWNLALDDENKKALMKIGAGEAIINAMNSHMGHKEVLQQACGALAALAISKDYLEKLMRIGAGEALLKAMNNHKNNLKIQSQGCSALWNLALNDENKKALMKIGAGEAIINAMKNHEKSVEIQHKASMALKILISIDETIVGALEQGLDFKIADLIDVLQANNDKVTSPSKNTDPIRVLNELKERILKYEAKEPSIAYECRRQYMKHCIQPKSTVNSKQPKLRNNNQFELFDAKYRIEEEKKSINDAVKISIIPKLESLQTNMNQLLDRKEKNLDLFNLRLLMNKYYRLSKEQQIKSKSLASTPESLAALAKRIREKFEILNNAEKKLGNRKVENDEQLQNLKEFIETRDKARNKFISELNEYNQMKQQLLKTKNNVENQNKNEIDHVVEEIKKLMSKISDSTSLLSQQLNFVNGMTKSGEGNDSPSKRMKNDEEDHKLERRDSMINPQNKILNAIMIEPANELASIQNMMRLFDADDENLASIQNKFTTVDDILDSISNEINQHQKCTSERHSLLEKENANLFDEVKIFLEKRINEEENKRKMESIQSIDYLRGLNCEREIELQSRKSQIDGIFDKVKELNPKLKAISKTCAEINVKYHDDNMTNEKQKFFDNELRDLEKRMDMLKNEQNNLVEQIIQLSRSKQSTSSSNSISSAIADKTEQYDFPEIPLLAEQSKNYMKSKLS